MRLSNAWRTLKFAGLMVIGAAILLFCAWQLYSAATGGPVAALHRGHEWVTFQSSRGWFVGSVAVYALVVATFALLLVVELVDPRPRGRWRTRRDLDTAIRQSPEER
jgi:hypothetical protein